MNKNFVKPWVGLRLLANFYSKVNMSRSKLKGSTGGILHWPSKALHRMSILWCTIAIKAHEVVSGIFFFKLNIDESLPEVTCCCYFTNLCAYLEPWKEQRRPGSRKKEFLWPKKSRFPIDLILKAVLIFLMFGHWASFTLKLEWRVAKWHGSDFHRVKSLSMIRNFASHVPLHLLFSWSSRWGGEAIFNSLDVQFYVFARNFFWNSDFLIVFQLVTFISFSLKTDIHGRPSSFPYKLTTEPKLGRLVHVNPDCSSGKN